MTADLFAKSSGGGDGRRSAVTSREPLWQLSKGDGGRLIACLLLAVVAAIVTGPDGSGDEPLRGIKGSLHLRAVFFLLGGLVLWAVLVIGRKVLPLLKAPRAKVAKATNRALEPAWARSVLYLALLAVAIVVPRGLSSAAQTSLVNDIAIYALLGLGLNVVVGFAGLLDLGYIAFYAIGAYVTAYFTSKTAIPWHAPFVLNPFFVFPIAVVAAALAGVILGGPTLRLRGDYLAIVTLGFGEIVYLLAKNAQGITNGARGAFGVPKLSISVGPVKYKWGLDALPYYYLLLGIIVLVMIAFSLLNKSRTGRALAAIREDEVAAEAMGVPTLKYKLIAFAIGASVSGFAGVIFATEQFFDPSSFTFQASILVLTVVIFGGMGSIFGVVLGAIVLQGLLFYLRDTVPQNDRYIYFGAVIMLMMIFRPQGLLPSRRRSREIALSEAGVGHADATMSGEPLVTSLAKDEVAGAPPSGPPVLEVKGVTLRFGGLTSLDNVSMTMAAGSVQAVIGPNGAGKTSLFNCLTGAYRPQQGSVTFHGATRTSSIVGMKPHNIARLGIARTFQNIRLFPALSALENVQVAVETLQKSGPLSAMLGLPRSRRDDRASVARSLELLERVGLRSRANVLSAALPYGEQRRLEIARALGTGPRLLLLDEPAAGTNPTEKRELAALIRRIADDDVSVLLIEHDMPLVMGLAQHVVVLNFGRVIAGGSPAEVQRDPAVIEAYLGTDDEVTGPGSGELA